MKVKKQKALLAEEKIKAIIGNKSTDAFAELIGHFLIIEEELWSSSISLDKPLLKVNTILSICTEVSGIQASVIQTSRDDRYRIIQDTFIAAAFCYSDFGWCDLAKYMHRHRSTILRGLRSIASLLLSENESLERSTALAILLKCEESSLGITENIRDINFSEVEELQSEIIDITNLPWHLPKSRIQAIPFRRFHWFDDITHVLVYWLDGSQAKWLQCNSWTLRGLLFSLQIKGARIIEYSQDDFIAVKKPCSTCIENLNGRCPTVMQEAIFCPRHESTGGGQLVLRGRDEDYEKLTKPVSLN